ncbi:uncharacterized protein LAESUDRAFT_666021, partial [Laetiporus sulphureus 93-53]
LLAYQFNWVLYGVLVMQVYTYHQVSFRDHVAIKCLVYGLFALETVRTILLTHDSFQQLALNWGSLEGLYTLNYLWLDVPIFIGISSVCIQCFYAWHIYILGQSKALSILILLVALMQCGGAFAEGILSKVYSNVPGTQINTLRSCTVWLAGTSTCDVIIACSMVYHLSRKRTGYKSTDIVINKLIQLVIETGMATAIIAIIELSLFLQFKHNFYHIVPALLLSKMYSNSLLALLNNRVSLRNQASNPNSSMSPAIWRDSSE